MCIQVIAALGDIVVVQVAQDDRRGWIGADCLWRSAAQMGSRLGMASVPSCMRRIGEQQIIRTCLTGLLDSISYLLMRISFSF